MTANEVLRPYVTIVYWQNRNLNQTARQLGLDRRTVKSKLAASPSEPQPKVEAGV